MFSQRLLEAIKKKGLSRYKIAKDTKITEATLSNYCNGKVKPIPSMVKQLADYLEEDYDWLLNGVKSDNGDAGRNIAADSTDTYRKRKKAYTKNNLKSIIDYFEGELKVKNELLVNNEEEIRIRLTSIEEKLELLIKADKIGKQ